MRETISLTDSMLDVFIKMSEGNPGALSVLSKIAETSGSDAFLVLLNLDDMNIRGTQIWVGYKDHCDSDLSKFIRCVNDRDNAMIDTINTEGVRGNHTEKAVTHGGSVKRESLK